MGTTRISDERGAALIMAILLSLLVAGLAIGMILMSGTGQIVAKFHANEAMMEAAADAGLEVARDRLNGSPTLLPSGLTLDTVTLEKNAPVLDASGATIPGFTRTTYAGRTGNKTGQYGVFASVISVISNSRGAVVVRRSELRQESFAKFARFFNTWNCCMFGNQEVIFGPVHSNANLAVQSKSGFPGATFNGPVSVVGSITGGGQSQGNWNGGLTTGAPAIPFPTTQTLTNLQGYATTGNMVVTGYSSLTATDPDTRIEFVAVDLNADGDTQDADEGFFRVYRANSTPASQYAANRTYLNAKRWNQPPPSAWPSGTSATADPNLYSPNCGGTWSGAWWTADSIYTNQSGSSNNKRDAVRAAMTGTNASGNARRCYLGGDPRLFRPGSPALASGIDARGRWQTWTGWGGAADSRLVTALGGNAALALTYWPVSRALNPNFKGVIYVNGSVAVSGLLRGRVTLVATGNIMIADDINYVTAANTTCADILGLLTPQDVIIQDNNVNTPFNVNNAWTTQFDESTNENINAFILTLGEYTGENLGVSEPAAAPEACAGGSRGCNVLVGGTIQQGIAATYSGSTGWPDRQTYDHCGTDDPPPYYPTTGRFSKNRYYEIDPVGFNMATWFANNQ